MSSDYISQDLVALILKRLPVKILLRFKCVCKSWKQVIESTSFTHQHLAVPKSPRLIVTNSWNNNLNLLDQHTLPLIYDDDSANSVTIPYTTEKPIFASTLHGVICYLDDLAHSVIIWNPSIRQHFQFPLPCGRNAYSDYNSFWIDPFDNNAFKVVLFDVRKGNNVALYSSRKRAWMEVDMNLEIVGNNYEPDWKSYQLTVGGVAYWRAYYLGSVIVMFFDFGLDKFGTTELPLSVPHKYINVCKWRGFLSVAHWNIDSCNRYDQWVMQNGSWSKMFSCNLVTMMKDILCVFESCGRVLALTWSCGDLVLCDPNSSVSSCACITLQQAYQNKVIVAYDFVESLVFPDPKSGAKAGDDKIELLLSQVKVKDINEFPVPADDAPAAEANKEEKVEESDDMSFSHSD